MSDRPARSHAIRRLILVLAGGVAGVAVGLAGVYGIATLTGNLFGGTAKDAACRPAVALRVLGGRAPRLVVGRIDP